MEIHITGRGLMTVGEHDALHMLRRGMGPLIGTIQIYPGRSGRSAFINHREGHGPILPPTHRHV